MLTVILSTVSARAEKTMENSKGRKILAEPHEVLGGMGPYVGYSASFVKSLKRKAFGGMLIKGFRGYRYLHRCVRIGGFGFHGEMDETKGGKEIAAEINALGPAVSYEPVRIEFFDMAFGLGIGLGHFSQSHKYKDAILPEGLPAGAKPLDSEAGFGMLYWPTAAIGFRVTEFLKITVLAHSPIATNYKGGYIFAPGGSLYLIFGKWIVT